MPPPAPIEPNDTFAPMVQFITISTEDAGQRLDNYLFRILKGVPKTRIYRTIRKGEVRVNKKRTTAQYKLQENDYLRVPPVRIPEKSEIPRVPAYAMDRLSGAILYEDSDLIILNKPSGLAVHGGSGITCGVIEILRQVRSQDKNLELVHRLDRDTSGCLMIAKKRSTLRHIHAQLREQGGIEKSYHALVDGHWPSRKLQIKAPLQKNILRSGERMVRVHVDGKPSKTCYRIIQHFNDATLVEAFPITGRTHQIRVHCLHAGHAILGDVKYGNDQSNQDYKKRGLERLFLHAASIELALPSGKEIKVSAPLPLDLQTLLQRLE